MVVRSSLDPVGRFQRLNNKPSRTKQSFAKDADINNILKKYRDTSTLVHVSNAIPKYGDFSSLKDYQSSLNMIHEAQVLFASLPSDVRSRFKNDPGQLIAFLSDPRNKTEAVQLGLVIDEIQTTPLPAAPVSGAVQAPNGGKPPVPPVTT